MRNQKVKRESDTIFFDNIDEKLKKKLKEGNEHA